MPRTSFTPNSPLTWSLESYKLADSLSNKKGPPDGGLESYKMVDPDGLEPPTRRL